MQSGHQARHHTEVTLPILTVSTLDSEVLSVEKLSPSPFRLEVLHRQCFVVSSSGEVHSPLAVLPILDEPGVRGVRGGRAMTEGQLRTCVSLTLTLCARFTRSAHAQPEPQPEPQRAGPHLLVDSSQAVQGRSSRRSTLQSARQCNAVAMTEHVMNEMVSMNKLITAVIT